MISYLDTTARKLLDEGRRQYALLGLEETRVLRSGKQAYVFTWSGDAANDALVLLLGGLGIEKATNEGLAIVVDCPEDRLFDAFLDISQLEDRDYYGLLTDVFNMRRGKWDWALPDTLLRKSFVSSYLDFEGAREVGKELVQSAGGSN